jgi:two-component system, sensor histidine kinase YesM
MRSFYLNFLILFLPFLFVNTCFAQDTIVKRQQRNLNSAADDLKKALDKKDELRIAINYELLAKEFSKKGENAKAEEYFVKALAIYSKLNAVENQAQVSRNIAKAQESQFNFKDAIANYEIASDNTKDKLGQQLNYNDANRLRNNSNIKIQEGYLNSNVAILKNENKTDEISQIYVQTAQNSLQKNDPSNAILNYKRALDYSKAKPKEIIKLNNEIAKVYVADNQLQKALVINQKLLAEAQKTNDFETQITQMRSLASIYFKQNDAKNALLMLKNAYKIAFENGKTAEAKMCLTQMISFYKTNNNDKESIVLYEQFFQNFDALIQKDTTLIDAKTFQITEQKIVQLEKERSLKDELISRKNRFNYVLIGSVLLLLLIFGFLVKALFSIKKKNKEIALQSLRREMNPHFIFNSLNSVNQFISQNKELEANKYLTSYSNLMRNIMENSNKDFVTLSNEVEQLKKYLDLEHLRFQDKFDFEILIDDNLDSETTFIPNMIIQPHLENAIWHGLRYLENKGFLSLKFELNNKKICVIIDDNGIGLSKSQELKTFNQMVHKSVGLDNTKQRISLLNDLYKTEISFIIKEKNFPNLSPQSEQAKQTGTIVEIIFPLIDKIK